MPTANIEAPLKSGLDAASQTVPGESPEEFAELQSRYFAQYAPTTPEQRFLVDQVIRNEWMLLRYQRVEDQLWIYQARLYAESAGVQLGEAFYKAAKTFQQLRRLITAVTRARKEALEELKRLRQPPQPVETKNQSSKLASFLTNPDIDLDRLLMHRPESVLTWDSADLATLSPNAATPVEPDVEPEPSPSPQCDSLLP